MFYTYIAITLNVIQTALWTPAAYSDTARITLQTMHGSLVTWETSATASATGGTAGATLINTTFPYPANLIDTTGDAIILRMIVSLGGGGNIGSTLVFPVNISYSFYYSVTSP
jgi:hypothetical protein